MPWPGLSIGSRPRRGRGPGAAAAGGEDGRWEGGPAAATSAAAADRPEAADPTAGRAGAEACPTAGRAVPAGAATARGPPCPRREALLMAGRRGATPGRLRDPAAGVPGPRGRLGMPAEGLGASATVGLRQGATVRAVGPVEARAQAAAGPVRLAGRRSARLHLVGCRWEATFPAADLSGRLRRAAGLAGGRGPAEVRGALRGRTWHLVPVCPVRRALMRPPDRSGRSSRRYVGGNAAGGAAVALRSKLYPALAAATAAPPLRSDCEAPGRP